MRFLPSIHLWLAIFPLAFYLSLDSFPRDAGYLLALIKLFLIYPTYGVIALWFLLRIVTGTISSKNKLILACLNIIFVFFTFSFMGNNQEILGSERLADMIRAPFLITLWLVYFSASIIDTLMPKVLAKKWILPSLVTSSAFLCFAMSSINVKTVLEAVQPTTYPLPLIVQKPQASCHESFYSVYDESFAESHNLPAEFIEPLAENLHYVEFQKTNCIPKLRKGMPIEQEKPYEAACFINLLISPQQTIAIADRRLSSDPEIKSSQIKHAQTLHQEHRYRELLGSVRYREDAFNALQETMYLKNISRSLSKGIPGAQSSTSGTSGIVLIPNMVNNLTYITSRFFPCPYNKTVFADSSFILSTEDHSENPVMFHIPNRIIRHSQNTDQ